MNVVPLPLPWLEMAILAALLGALCVSSLRDPLRAWRWGLLFSSLSFLGTALACLGFYLCREADVSDSGGLQTWLFGRAFFGLDELNAPLLPVVGLLHLLTILATGRTKMRRFSSTWSLASEAIRLATFACTTPGLLIGLLTAGTVPPYIELVNRGRPTRVYLLHMAQFVGLRLPGWAFVNRAGGRQTQPALAAVALLAAILVRCGTVPAHCWVTDWFEHASFGNALLYVTPLTGVYAAIRLVLPIAPD